MSETILNGATNHFNFRELPNSKIILSEEAYIRLSGDINLCAFSGNNELEYGTFSYGKEIKPNIIYFDYPSEFEDYEPQKRVIDVSHDKNGEIPKMHKELIRKI